MRDNPDLTLIVGGARSGKSAYAERLIRTSDPPWLYVATGQACDDEMKRRIAEHQARRDDQWQTVEAPLELAGIIESLPPGRPALIDCLTLWLTNHMMSGCDPEEAGPVLTTALASRSGPTIAVTNEVGQGIVPIDAMPRKFRDAAGELNQAVASVAGKVVLMVAGIPMRVK